MDYTSSPPAQSSENFTAPEGSVYDLDTLKLEAEALGIPPTRPNIRRIRRAFDFVEKDRVKRIGFIEGTRIYEITSQSREDYLHLAVSNGITQCTCEDARRQANFENCKHSIAVRITERQAKEAADAETYQDWMTERRLHY